MVDKVVNKQEGLNVVRLGTVPAALFEEFRADDVSLDLLPYPPHEIIASVKETVPFVGAIGAYMVLRQHGCGDDELAVMIGDVRNRNTIFNWELLTVAQRWSNAVVWGAGSGFRQRYTLHGSLGHRGTILYGPIGTLVSQMISRAVLLSSQYDLGAERWEHGD